MGFWKSFERHIFIKQLKFGQTEVFQTPILTRSHFALGEINKEPNYSTGPLMKTNLLIAVLLVALYSCNLSGESEKERQLFDKIRTGMTKEEVIRILGDPDTITYNIVDSSEAEFLYVSKNKSGLRSTMPTVSFDSTSRVTFATYGE